MTTGAVGVLRWVGQEAGGASKRVWVRQIFVPVATDAELLMTLAARARRGGPWGGAGGSDGWGRLQGEG